MAHSRSDNPHWPFMLLQLTVLAAEVLRIGFVKAQT
jgi:hypothetical protein